MLFVNKNFRDYPPANEFAICLLSIVSFSFITVQRRVPFQTTMRDLFWVFFGQKNSLYMFDRFLNQPLQSLQLRRHDNVKVSYHNPKMSNAF